MNCECEHGRKSDAIEEAKAHSLLIGGGTNGIRCKRSYWWWWWFRVGGEINVAAAIKLRRETIGLSAAGID